MADDYPNNSSTMGSLQVGGMTTGSLEATNDADWFAYSVKAGFNYRVDLAATPGFTNPTTLNFYVVNSSGTILFGHTYSANKSLDFTAATSGTDYLVVASNSGTGIGNYTLTSAIADDYPSNSSTSATLAAGGIISGSLEATDDADWISVPVRSGYNVQFTLTAAAGAISPSNFNMFLVDVNGVVLTGHNYSANKSIDYLPTSSGTDYLIVGSNSGQTVGAYSIVESQADDYLANSSTTGKLAIGGSTTGKLEGTDDTDWFGVSLSAGSTYQFNLAATPGFTNPSNLDLTLVNVNGTRVAAGGSSDKSASYTPTVSGTYYLAVSSAGGNGIGTYILTSPTNILTSPTNGSTPVFRFFDTNSGTQFLTSSTSERDNVIGTRPDLTYEGVGLNAATSTDPNASAVYRFFDTIHGTHFFTSSSTERDSVAATRSDLTYEGIGFYEYTSQQSGSTAVYRFFDTHAGTHFYTSNAGERANIIATRSDLTDEGTAFYAPT